MIKLSSVFGFVNSEFLLSSISYPQTVHLTDSVSVSSSLFGVYGAFSVSISLQLFLAHTCQCSSLSYVHLPDLRCSRSSPCSNVLCLSFHICSLYNNRLRRFFIMLPKFLVRFYFAINIQFTYLYRLLTSPTSIISLYSFVIAKINGRFNLNSISFSGIRQVRIMPITV